MDMLIRPVPKAKDLKETQKSGISVRPFTILFHPCKKEKKVFFFL